MGAIPGAYAVQRLGLAYSKFGLSTFEHVNIKLMSHSDVTLEQVCKYIFLPL